jgi:hypothetical protein
VPIHPTEGLFSNRRIVLWKVSLMDDAAGTVSTGKEIEPAAAMWWAFHMR